MLSHLKKKTTITYMCTRGTHILYLSLVIKVASCGYNAPGTFQIAISKYLASQNRSSVQQQAEYPEITGI